MSDECVADDGLIARATGPWVEEKLRPLARYLDIVTTAMKRNPRFPAGVVFVDLMAGPGRCVDVRSRAGGKTYKGSTLIALDARYPCRHVIAIESEPKLAAALIERTAQASARPMVIESDCNAPETIERVWRATEGALTLMFIDLLGTEVDFETIRQLTANRDVDLLITWPEMDLNRNRGALLANTERLNRFFGTTSWQELAHTVSGPRLLRTLQRLYLRQLESIGYRHHNFLRGVRNQRGGLLYRPLFAARHPLGLDFWKKASSDSAVPGLFDL